MQTQQLATIYVIGLGLEAIIAVTLGLTIRESAGRETLMPVQRDQAPALRMEDIIPGQRVTTVTVRRAVTREVANAASIADRARSW
jgi:hypothetical protein